MWKVEGIVKKGDVSHLECFSSRVKNIHGKTAEVEKAISENLVREFLAHDNSEETIDNGIRRGHTPST